MSDNLRNASGTPQNITRRADGRATLTPTAKMAAAGITMGALVIVVAMLAAISPEMLSGLGQWGPVVYAGIVAAGGFLAGYIKRPN